MPSIRDVIEYSGLDYESVLDLRADVFLLMRKNKIIDDLRKTSEGREYLEDCKRLSETKLDEKGLLKIGKGVIK